jgi:glycogen operon protein
LNENVTPGKSFPLGATVQEGGVNFSIYSKNSTAMELCFFRVADDATPQRVIQLDPKVNRTFHYWHVFVPGVRSGQIYAYRAS